MQCVENVSQKRYPPLDHEHGRIPPSLHRFNHLKDLQDRTPFLMLPILIIIQLLRQNGAGVAVKLILLLPLLLGLPGKVSLYVGLLHVPKLSIGHC